MHADPDLVEQPPPVGAGNQISAAFDDQQQSLPHLRLPLFVFLPVFFPRHLLAHEVVQLLEIGNQGADVGNPPAEHGGPGESLGALLNEAQLGQNEQVVEHPIEAEAQLDEEQQDHVSHLLATKLFSDDEIPEEVNLVDALEQPEQFSRIAHLHLLVYRKDFGTGRSVWRCAACNA